MAVTNRSGSDGSAVMIGRQTAIGTPLTQNSDMVPRAFPIISNSFGLAADVEESRLITALGADTPNEIAQFWSAGSFEFQIYVDDFIEPLRGIVNPSIAANSALITSASADIPYSGTTAVPSTAGDKVAPLSGKGIPLVQDSRSTTAKYEFVAKPTIVLSAAPTAGSKIFIEGKKAAGIDKSIPGNRPYYLEEITTTTATSYTASNFFAEVDNIYFTGITTGTFAVTWTLQTYFLQLKIQANDPRFTGWTYMATKGGVPELAYDVIPNQMTISADNTGISAAFDCLGGQYQQRRTVAGGLNAERLALQSADNTYFVQPDTRSMSGWAGALNIGDVNVGYNSLDLVMNRNLEFQDTVTGNKYKRNPSPSNNRQVTFSPRIPFSSGSVASDVFNKWDEIFRDDQRSSAELTLRNYGSDGRVSQMDIEFASTQLIETPTTEVTGRGPIEQALSFKSLSTSSESSEIIFNIWQKSEYTI